MSIKKYLGQLLTLNVFFSSLFPIKFKKVVPFFSTNFIAFSLSSETIPIIFKLELNLVFKFSTFGKEAIQAPHQTSQKSISVTLSVLISIVSFSLNKFFKEINGKGFLRSTFGFGFSSFINSNLFRS